MPSIGAGGSSESATDLESENQDLPSRTMVLEQENAILRWATNYFARDVLPNHVPAGP